MNNGASIPNSDPPQDCNGKKWTETGQWYSTDRVGLYNVYHPHDDKNPFVWQAVKVISDGPGGLQIDGTPMPRADVFSGTGRIFVGWNDGWNGVWNMAWSDQDINFATLPRPITGPNTAVYWAHGLTRLMFRMKSLVVGTVWTSANVSSPRSSDLWFIK